MSNDNITVEFSFQDRPDLGVESVTIPCTANITHFRKVIQAYCGFSVDEYQIQYDAKLRKAHEVFKDFWSPIDNKELSLIKPSNSGAK